MWKNALLNYCETHTKAATLWSAICGMGQNAKSMCRLGHRYVEPYPVIAG